MLTFLFLASALTFSPLTYTMGSNKDNNEKTLQAYEINVNTYVEQTPQIVSGEIKQWIDRALGFITKDATVLELGSGFGRDANYIQSLGYTIELTDGAASFVALLQGMGYKARVLNLLTDTIGGSYSMIFANAVLLHFSPQELKEILEKLHQSLLPSGILAFTVKQGNGQDWEHEKLNAPRYFCYWQPDSLRALLSTCGFKIEELSESSDAKWLRVIARKS